MRVGYRRVSSVEQKFDRQELGELDKVFEEKISGSTSERLALSEMIDFVRENDEVVVYSIDRLARNLKDLQYIIEKLNGKGASIHFISENLTFNVNSNDAFAKKMAKPETKTVTRTVAVPKTKIVKQEPQQQTASNDTERTDFAPIRPQPPLPNQRDDRDKR